MTSPQAAPNGVCGTEIDLRSDFASPSNPEMLAAMQDAARQPSGFDFREGAYVQQLEQETAVLLGKEDAIWFPTCTMANLVAVLLQTGLDGAVVTQADNHVATTERDSITDIARRKVIGLSPTDGLVAPKAFADAIFSDSAIELVVLENTHNRSGGLPLPAGYAKQIGVLAAEKSIKLHLDGSRLFNAAIAQNVDPASLCEEAETVSISLNKGLGAPNGAMLAGPAQLMERAGTLRRQLGGGVRPLNMMAAAGLVALQQWRGLSRDHHVARRMATALVGVPGYAVDLDQVQTNIILVRLDLDCAGTTAFVAALAQRGVRALDFGAGCIRFCVHCGIAENAVPRVAEAFMDVVRAMDVRAR